MEDRGSTLIVVPYWWDGKPESLVATLRERRPELFPLFPLSESIPEESPFSKKSEDGVPNIGELMLASFAVNSNFTEPWWCGEKYDGIRACWNGDDKELSGRKFLFPFREIMPTSSVDGEIWLGRNSFHETVPFSSLFPKADKVKWHEMRMVAFDCLDLDTRHLPYWERFTKLVIGLETDDPFLKLFACFKVQESEVISRLLQKILENQGEGLVFRFPLSNYEHGRSSYLLKMKATRDKDALVVEVDEINKIFILSLSNGATFDAKLHNDNLHPLPKEGDVVTFSYVSVDEKGNPIRPKIVRVRHDATWHNPSQLAQSTSEITQKALTTSTNKPRGYWTQDDHKNIKIFFDEFAKKHNFDPTNVENWYPINFAMIAETEGGRTVLEHYNGSLARALIDVYPNLQLDPTKFRITRRYYWREVENQRNFFIELANKRKFDPLLPSNWYLLTADKVVTEKGGSAILSHYGGSLVKALLKIFPEIGLKETNFEGILRQNWIGEKSRKIIFENIARKKGFDALVADNWYSISEMDITNEKGGSVMLEYYGGSVVKGLISIFPNIGLKEEKFHMVSRQFWSQEKNRRNFFDEFANKHEFDPLNPFNWYHVTRSSVISEKGGIETLLYYKSLSAALIHLYPNIGLDPLQFPRISRLHWKEPQNRRKFFCDFADRRGFDPLIAENWYPIYKENIISEKGGAAALDFYNGSLANALVSVFPNVIWQPENFVSSSQSTT